MKVANFSLFVLVVVSANAFCSTAVVFDSNYRSEVYATYPSSKSLGQVGGMEFDSEGNLFVSHYGAEFEGNDGSIYKITPDGNANEFVSGLHFPGNMVWTGGTDYGDYLYVGDGTRPTNGRRGGIYRVDMQGNISPFATAGNEPYALGFDEEVGMMFAGTRGDDHLDKVLSDGSTQLFSGFPYGMNGGGPAGIDINNGDKYPGYMYLSNDGKGENYSGVFKLDENGSASRVAEGILTSFRLGFDDVGDFDNSLFATGISREHPGLWSLYKIEEDGTYSLFATGGDMHLNVFTFGPDGAIYAATRAWYSDKVTISRISLIPEPATLALFGVGVGAILRRKQ
ncbi:hypothetical protein STSP2_02821 [Anaerohalosphaera lusitana]|uniref:Ice-binding protein C-terminal domain-containing protein n=1 Tax=Anaerohalosphaera lusitana TaxID=1936003 RepID=A0A1U9NP99_9BACT|nr:PEP-CTERM sorting domain-containing protein [Anaerohalosphaera lusitana]AQT69627.1 hypothetical protein STSP2_02821 [Anaerohalosphaera lusitana]